MKRFKYAVVLSLLFILTITNSCNTVYSDYQDTGIMRWDKADKKTFNVEIEEAGKYDLYFGMRYGTGFPFRYMKVKVSQKQPSGKEQEMDLQFMIIGADRQYIGEPLGQIWDYEKSFIENQQMEKGEYTYTIEHILNDDTAPAVMEIGFVVKKSDIENSTE